tara:strand:+ start:64 stop:435 length:372 start_codon:yes stop_codon:yes gene_type:complete
MALQGKFAWKGIELSDAYITINEATCKCVYNSKMIVKTPEVLNEDGSVKTEAVMEKEITKVLHGNFTAYIYKDKASKEANPDEVLDTIFSYYTPKHNTSAKNDVAQAYAALKALEAYKDLADA